jgi:hypothetical protein
MDVNGLPICPEPELIGPIPSPAFDLWGRRGGGPICVTRSVSDVSWSE